MLVSILIPCYNAKRWIAQCIESSLAQMRPEEDLIVVDDNYGLNEQ
jgi:glycosyltransferase involved in cell wall biosynthesis